MPLIISRNGTLSDEILGAFLLISKVSIISKKIIKIHIAEL